MRPFKENLSRWLCAMCSICGCSIDPAEGSGYEKSYRCLSCDDRFKAGGVAIRCPSCRSREIERVK